MYRLIHDTILVTSFAPSSARFTSCKRCARRIDAKRQKDAMGKLSCSFCIASKEQHRKRLDANTLAKGIVCDVFGGSEKTDSSKAEIENVKTAQNAPIVEEPPECVGDTEILEGEDGNCKQDDILIGDSYPEDPKHEEYGIGQRKDDKTKAKHENAETKLNFECSSFVTIRRGKTKLTDRPAPESQPEQAADVGSTAPESDVSSSPPSNVGLYRMLYSTMFNLTSAFLFSTVLQSVDTIVRNVPFNI
ncbi:hypothetical protein L596_022290 [Steinernema carpocapsae]|uniref:Uncharacterized protein n=1 Tax=Steinernema carpocapsae TaxID=34508 RepID=A0A4U5MLN4_STECR|nr:hypothetical protein L596_022290 [Steinernema carpocapsae]